MRLQGFSWCHLGSPPTIRQLFARRAAVEPGTAVPMHGDGLTTDSADSRPRRFWYDFRRHKRGGDDLFRGSRGKGCHGVTNLLD